VIRQTITCDICGAEKKQTNHWFVVHEQGDELRLTGWNSRSRLRAASKHLCGQVCLHKLADIFMARVIAEKATPHKESATDESLLARPTPDRILNDGGADLEFESSARLITPPSTLLSITAQSAQTELKAYSEPRPHPELVPAPARFKNEELLPSLDEPPRNASRQSRAEAWERERERERNPDRRTDNSARRHFHA
jgi:hypothetical protein